MSRVPALMVMHADLSSALLRAAEKVYGEIEDIATLSNEGLSGDALEEAIARCVEHWPEGGLVLTDVWGGSCYVCGVRAARGHGEVLILTGVNLPTLIDYLHNRDRYGATELAERLRLKGQESIRIQRGVAA